MFPNIVCQNLELLGRPWCAENRGLLHAGICRTLLHTCTFATSFWYTPDRHPIGTGQRNISAGRMASIANVYRGSRYIRGLHVLLAGPHLTGMGFCHNLRPFFWISAFEGRQFCLPVFGTPLMGTQSEPGSEIYQPVGWRPSPMFTGVPEISVACMCCHADPHLTGPGF